MSVRTGFLVLLFMISAGCGADPAPERIGTGSSPRLSVAPDGSAVAAWMDGTFLRARRLDPTTGWEDVVTLYDAAGSDAVEPLSPRLATSSAGHAMVVWQQTTFGGRFEVWAARFEPAAGWSEPELVLAVEEVELPGPGLAAVAMGPDGVATVATGPRFAWSPLPVLVARQAPGDPWSEPVSLSAAGSGGVALATMPVAPETTVVAWTERIGGTTELLAARYSLDSGWSPAQTIPRATSGTSLALSSLHAGVDGTFWITWVQNGAQVARTSPDGTWQDADLLAPDGRSPQLALDDRGGAIATWTVAIESSPEVAYSSRFDAETGWSDEERIGVGVGWVRLAGNGDGDAAVTWIRGTALEVRRTAPSSGWADAEELQSSDGLSSPSIGVDAQGRMLVLWQDSICDDVSCDNAIRNSRDPVD